MRPQTLLGILVSVAFLISCSGSDGGSGVAGTGTLALSLSDNSTEDYRAVYVTINSVEVHLGGNENRPGNWQPLALPADPNTGVSRERLTVNLLELVNGVREELGVAELEAGHYTQMRLIIDTVADGSINILSQNHPFANYVIDQGNPANVHELKVPSGLQTGVKIIGGYDIAPDQTTELILDFDACRSVVQAGNSGNWLLKPTIKTARLEDFSIIDGRVTDDTVDADPIAGALVSAQTFSGGETETRDDDALIVHAATISDPDGGYKLFVAPGTYNLVVYAGANVPDFRKISTSPGQVLQGAAADFTLGGSATGTVGGDVTIAGADPEQHAALSFRQAADCAACAAHEQIEVKAINVANASAYDTALPVGTYSLAASSFGYPTQNPPDFDITDGAVTVVDITF